VLFYIEQTGKVSLLDDSAKDLKEVREELGRHTKMDEHSRQIPSLR